MPRFTPIKSKTVPVEPIVPATTQIAPKTLKKAKANGRENPPVHQIAAQPTVTEVKLVVNDERQGLELHFPGKPSEEILNELRNGGPGANRWHFHFAKKFWYTHNTAQAKAWAEAFVARHRGKSPAPTAPVPPSKPVETNIIPVNFQTPEATGVSISPTPMPAVPAWRRRTTV